MHKGYREQLTRRISLIEVGNQVFAPLLAGLQNSLEGMPSGFATDFKGLNTHIPLGNEYRPQQSFYDQQSRRPKVKKDSDDDLELDYERDYPTYKISPFTRALGVLHNEVVDVGYNMGAVIDWQATKQGATIPTLIERIKQEPDVVEKELSAEQLPEVVLHLKQGDGKPPVDVRVPNVPIGAQQRSLAHVLLALGLAGETVINRNRVLGDFMHRATGGFVHTLPPLQMAVQKYLEAELSKKGLNAQDVLSASGLDIDQGRVRAAFEELLPFAEIYEEGCKLKGATKPDYVQKAFAQMKKFCAPRNAEMECRDGYECGQVLEAMLEHAISRSTGHQKQTLEGLKSQFLAEARPLLAKAAGVEVEYMPAESVWPSKHVATVQEVMRLPTAEKVIEAFADCYAADVLLDKPDSPTQRMWGVRTRLRADKGSEPSL